MCHDLQKDLGARTGDTDGTVGEDTDGALNATVGEDTFNGTFNGTLGGNANSTSMEMLATSIHEDIETSGHLDATDLEMASPGLALDQDQASTHDSGCTRPQNEVHSPPQYLLIPLPPNLP